MLRIVLLESGPEDSAPSCIVLPGDGGNISYPSRTSATVMDLWPHFLLARLGIELRSEHEFSFLRSRYRPYGDGRLVHIVLSSTIEDGPERIRNVGG